MTSLTLTTTSSIRQSVSAPTAAERALLRLSRVLAAAATSRMEQRAASTPSAGARTAAADRRRDAAATVHAGLLPR